MKKYFALALALAIATTAFAGTAMAATVDSTTTSITTAGEYTLENDVTLSHELEISGDIDVTLNLNGKTLSNSTESSYVIAVTENARLTITGNGTISGPYRGIRIGGTGMAAGADGAVIMENGTISAADAGVALYANNSPIDRETQYATSFTMNGGKITGGAGGIYAFGNKATVTIKGGEISSTAYAISGNGSHDNTQENGKKNCSGTVINIEGGTITSSSDVAIYHPQTGELNISGGTITGHDGIQILAGTLNLSGGTITATGTFSEVYDKDSDGSILGGAALSILSRSGYLGNINVNISGTPTLTSENGYAIAEATVTYRDAQNTTSMIDSISISGGTFNAPEGKDAISTEFATAENTTITGGTFSSNLAANSSLSGLNLPTMSLDKDNNFVAVTIPATDFEIDDANLAQYAVGDTVQLHVGQTVQLNVLLTPSDSNDIIVWTSDVPEADTETDTASSAAISRTRAAAASSNTAAATVSDSGLVTAVAVGESEIKGTITHVSGDGKTIEEAIVFKVVEAPTAPQPTPESTTGSSGGGCSAGFGALALLAALPLLRMRKK